METDDPWASLPEPIKRRAQDCAASASESLLMWLGRAISAQADRDDRLAAAHAANREEIAAMMRAAADQGDLLAARRAAFLAQQRAARQRAVLIPTAPKTS